MAIVNQRGQILYFDRAVTIRAANRMVAILVALFLAGCSGDMSSVSGQVTLDGKPVEGSPDLYGQVLFYRDGGGGAPAVAIVQGGGHYEVSTGSRKGMEPGAYNIAVSVKKILPPATQDGLPRAEQLSAVKFTSPKESGFKADVKPGSNTFNFALQSK